MTLIKAVVRFLYVAIFMMFSFFHPYTMVYQDGSEHWEFGQYCFAAFVMERVEEDRKRANRIAALIGSRPEQKSSDKIAGFFAAMAATSESNRASLPDPARRALPEESVRMSIANVIAGVPRWPPPPPPPPPPCAS